MRDYRKRVKTGDVGEPASRAYVMPEGPVPQLEPAVRAEVESLWQVEYRRVLSAWLLGQRSPHTRRAYQQAWRAWCAWCDQHEIDPVEPASGTGGVWLAAMQASGLSVQTRRLRSIAVRQFLCEHLLAEGLRVGGDPFGRVKLPPAEWESSTIPLSDADVRRVVAASRELPGQVEAAVLLCAVSGLRSMEAAQIGPGCISDSQWGPVMQFRRKGDTLATIPLPAVVAAAARRGCWPSECTIRVDGAPHIAHLVGAAGKRAGVRLTPHQLRHWHVTTALASGVELHRVQESVGHRDPKTTMRYNRARVIVIGHSSFAVAKALEDACGDVGGAASFEHNEAPTDFSADGLGASDLGS